MASFGIVMGISSGLKRWTGIAASYRLCPSTGVYRTRFGYASLQTCLELGIQTGTGDESGGIWKTPYTALFPQ